MMAWPPKRAWRAGPAGERGAGWRSVQTYGEFTRAPGGFMRWACSHFQGYLYFHNYIAVLLYSCSAWGESTGVRRESREGAGGGSMETSVPLVRSPKKDCASEALTTPRRRAASREELAGCNARHGPASLLADENCHLLLSSCGSCCSSTLCLGFRACACTFDPQIRLLGGSLSPEQGFFFLFFDGASGVPGLTPRSPSPTDERHALQHTG